MKKYSKNKINGVIIDYDLVGLILDAKIERFNNNIVSKTKILSIKQTFNPNTYAPTQNQIMQWMSAEQKYLEIIRKK